MKDEIRDLIEIIAEERIREAMENGEFDNLPGMGRPLELEDLSNVPEEYRAAYKVLKNAHILPPEVELRKEIAALEGTIAACKDPAEKRALRAKLQEKNIHYSVLMEKRRRR